MKKRKICQTRLSDPFDSLPTIVCDPGSFSTKLGFAGAAAPREYQSDDFLKAMHSFIGIDENDRFPAGASLALVVDGFESRKWQREMVEILFEEYDVAKLAMPQSPASALVSRGKSTGLVVDVGHRKSRVIPIFEGFIDWRSACNSERGGLAIDRYLTRQINLRASETLSSSAVTAFKHSDCFFLSSAAHIDRYLRLDAETNCLARDFRLPDGSRLRVAGGERFMACEQLMKSDNEMQGLASLIDTCITTTSIDLRRPLLQNVLLTGGTSEATGLDVRLLKDITNIQHMENIGKHAAFIGAASLAHTYRHYSEWWLVKAEVGEQGADRAVAKLIRPR